MNLGHTRGSEYHIERKNKQNKRAYGENIILRTIGLDDKYGDTQTRWREKVN